MSHQELGQETDNLWQFVENEIFTFPLHTYHRASIVIEVIRNNPTKLGHWGIILSRYQDLNLALECGPLSNSEQDELRDLAALTGKAFGIHTHRVFIAYDEMINSQIASIRGVQSPIN